MTLALLSLLLAIDPCAPIERLAPALELAAVYARVGAEEERRGALEASAAAWRRAAELELEGGPDQRALRRLCAQAAAQLLRLADRRERLVIEAAFEGGYDSNATLAAYASTLPGAANDGFGAATASLTFRPMADSGPYLFVGGGYRKQALYPQSDVGLGTGTLGWELKLKVVRASLDYGLDFVTLGAEPWLLRQRGTARALLPLGAVALSAEYSLRYEEYFEALPSQNPARRRESALADTGFRHAGRAAVSLGLDPHLLELSGLVLRALATTADRSSIEAGGELRWVVRPLRRLEVEAAVGARWRSFDEVDSDLLVRRRELQLDALLGADLELNQSLRLFVALEYRRVASSVGALTYSRLGASAGLRVWLGVW